MKKYNKLKTIIVTSSIIIFILFIFKLLLIFHGKSFNNIIIMNNFLFIMQLLSYAATIIGAVVGISSIIFAYVQYKNMKKENNNKISKETINMLNNFATKVIPYIERVDERYDILKDNILSNKDKSQTRIKAQALDDLTDQMNYIDFWCECLFIFKDRNMIQEEVLYNEDYDVFIDFLNEYMEAFKYNDPHNRYYKTLYILYNRWTNMNFHNIDNK